VPTNRVRAAATLQSKSRRQKRVDPRGRAFKGSQLQAQIYVNRLRGELEQAARAALPTLDEAARSLKWVSPLESDRFVEYQDSAFLRALRLERLAPDLSRFWPPHGPVWDALARVELHTGGEGVLLVEGKSYPKELYGKGCAAKAKRSKRLIGLALEETQAWLGLPVDAGRWMGSLYQSTNRLAHLYFLRERARVAAWLLHTCFIADVAHVAVSEEEWRDGLAQADRELGLAEASTYAAAVFLPARLRSDLLTASERDAWIIPR
jgi:hypothetical protein